MQKFTTQKKKKKKNEVKNQTFKNLKISQMNQNFTFKEKPKFPKISQVFFFFG